MTLSDLNTSAEAHVREALLRCCGSSKWAERMIARRPFADMKELSSSADEIWRSLHPEDWLEAFSKHPKIGEKKLLTDWSSEEQRNMKTAGTETSDSIAKMNQAYLEKFGWIFIVCATGKTPDKIRALFEQRLKNSASQELLIASDEQAQITRLRLQKLLEI